MRLTVLDRKILSLLVLAVLFIICMAVAKASGELEKDEPWRVPGPTIPVTRLKTATQGPG